MWICKGYKITLLKMRDEKSYFAKCEGCFERFFQKKMSCVKSPSVYRIALMWILQTWNSLIERWTVSIFVHFSFVILRAIVWQIRKFSYFEWILNLVTETTKSKYRKLEFLTLKVSPFCVNVVILLLITV